MKFKQKILLIALFLMAFIIRTVFVETIPSGFSNDEAAISYNAYLISQTKRDEWGMLFPFQFRSFGDWKLPVYIYLLAFLYKLVPLSIFWTRAVSAFFGSLTVIVLFYLVLILFKKYKERWLIALSTALILVFNPWHIGLSRIASEANIGLFFFITALYFFLGNTSKKSRLFLGFLFTLLCFYSYHVYRFLIPFIIAYLYVFKWKKKVTSKSIVKISLLFIAFCISIFISTKGKFLARLYQINLFSEQGIINEINEFRGLCLVRLPFVLCRTIFNKPIFWTQKFLFNYFSHLSPQFLFFPEFEKGYGILPHFSYFYLLVLPFFVWGVFLSIKNKNMKFLLFLLLISPIPSSLTGKGHFARPFPLIFPIIVFTGLGVVSLITFLKKKRILIFLVPLGVIYLFLVFDFFVSYFTYFPVKQARYSHYEYKPLFRYLKQVESDYDHIYISRVNHDTKQYIFYLFYFKINPEEYFLMDKVIEIEENDWVWVKKIGKFEFIAQADKLENYPEKSLLVIDPQGAEEFPKAKEIIKYPTGDIAFNIYDLDRVKEEITIID